MIRVELPVLVGKLNPIAKHTLEVCAARCMNEQFAEITVPQFLFSFLETPLCDIRVILAQSNIDIEELKGYLQEVVGKDGQLQAQQNYPSFSPLLVELLQDSWLVASTEFGHADLRSGIVLYVLLASLHRYVPHQAAKMLMVINREILKRDFTQLVASSSETELTKESGVNPTKTLSSGQECLLDKYAQNMTALARENKLDPVLCRDKEINLMIDILCRRRKNNPIVVGEAGVGKSALIEGLALRIVAGNVPEKLLDNDVMTLDLGALQAGAAVKGEFEKRFKGIMNEVLTSPKPIILFIDEAHTLIGAGNQQGGLDISNLLKPALARGELRTIAATTWSEYKKYFEKDAALSRRFQLVKLAEPTVDEAIVIMRGLRNAYEQSHQVLIEEDALISVAELSERYLSGRQLPDKAIDVLDTACARVAINLTSPPKLVAELENAQHQLKMEIDLLQREIKLGLSIDDARLSELQNKFDSNTTKLADISQSWQKQQSIVKEIIALRAKLLEGGTEPLEKESAIDVNKTEFANKEEKETACSSDETEISDVLSEEEIAEKLKALTQELDELQQTEILVSPHVTQKQIASVIAEWTGVPIDRLSQNELTVITDLPHYLSKEIKGQDLAIKHLHRHLLTARADLRRAGRPLGAFLFVGPSGVGKTETVLQVADLLFGGKQYLTTINMSEFQEKHTVSRLIGSPPGYVGFGEGGVLTEAIRRKPYSVVLLDEVEKAHPDVLNLFYQAFDKGELADGEGRIIDCKNIVFFLTSNLGYQTIVNHADTPEKIIDELYPELAEFFKPALLARMEVIPYLPLPKEVLMTIIEGKLNKLTTLLEKRFNAQVVVENEVKEEILRRASRAENGARILESVIDGQMLPPVSLLLLQQIAANKEIKEIYFGLRDNRFIAKVGEDECDLT
ncbi:type VI secretion system ATPase TssH [Glaesserella sp.]|uniref:type VI secretion system ATPase TssH n=1 Tax=Glaesserella sp. TaxID=2094731 RepID=UPI0035A1791A